MVNSFSWIRWIAGLLFLIPAIFLICMNAAIFWTVVIKKGPFSSMILYFGGVFGAIGLLLIPLAEIHQWWWLPFLLDAGSGLISINWLVSHLGELRKRHTKNRNIPPEEK